VIRTALLVSFVLLTAQPWAYGGSTWPTPDLPTSMRLTALGQETTVNGIPVRMQAFTATTTSQKLLETLKQRLGPHLVTNQLNGYTVVGQPIGQQGHYLTIQIYPLGEYAKGIVAVSQPSQWQHLQGEVLSMRRQWEDKLPNNSTLLHHQNSREGVWASEQITYRNTYGNAYNTQHLITQLARDGLIREHPEQSEIPAQVTQAARQGQVFFFKGRQQQAMATIHEQRPYTVVVLQIERQQKGMP
jgi:hypothetical protein